MNREELRIVLSEQARAFAGQSYDDLVPLIDAPIHRDHVTSSGTRYNVEISAAWNDEPKGVLRLFFSVDKGGIRWVSPLTRGTLVNRCDRFDGQLD